MQHNCLWDILKILPLIKNRKIILFCGCLVIFFPGAFVFGFPGVMASYWQELFHVNKEQIGKIMFFILAGTGCSMYLAGKLQEKISSHFIIFTGSLICAVSMLYAGMADSIADVYIWAFIEGFFLWICLHTVSDHFSKNIS